MLLDDQLVLGVERDLGVVAHADFRVRGHRPAVRVGQRDLALIAALQLLEHFLVARFALLQRSNLLGQVLRPTATRPILLGIGPAQAAQIVGQTLVRWIVGRQVSFG